MREEKLINLIKVKYEVINEPLEFILQTTAKFFSTYLLVVYVFT